MLQVCFELGERDMLTLTLQHGVVGSKPDGQQTDFGDVVLFILFRKDLYTLEIGLSVHVDATHLLKNRDGPFRIVSRQSAVDDVKLAAINVFPK